MGYLNGVVKSLGSCTQSMSPVGAVDIATRNRPVPALKILSSKDLVPRVGQRLL